MGAKAFLSSKKGKILLTGIAVVLITVALILLIVAVVQLKSKKCGEVSDRKKFVDFLNNVKKTYYKTFPHTVIFDPDVELPKVIDQFQLYNPKPSSIKARTDLALKLRKDLDNLRLDLTQLKPREKKAVAQLEHYLESVFGKPYSENYYAGDWMMGPQYFCWQDICSAAKDIRDHYNSDFEIVPKKLQDVERIIIEVKKVKGIFQQYKENMRLGVKAGMVRAVDDCQSGLDSFRSNHKNITKDGPQGALKDRYSFLKPDYFSQVSSNEQNAFVQKYGKNMVDKMKELVVSHIGVPIHNFMEFLEKNHSRYCVPPNVSSGLANLPLDRVWLDQKSTDEVTTKKLPTGEVLDGKKSYALILPYFTTSKKYTAENIFELGKLQRDKLYEQAVNISKEIFPGKTRNETIEAMKIELDLPRSFFNTTVIPDNENGQIGGKNCYDMKSAEKNCPNRFKALMEWFSFIESVLAKIDPMTVNMFYMTGKKSTTPNCPVKMRAMFNPSIGYQSYDAAGKGCLKPCYYNLPFFLKQPGPVYGAYTVAGHEARPGHHTQLQGFDEHFSSSGNKDVIDWLNGINYYTAFTEGWALYAENPLLSTETKLYENDPLQKYGMYKGQIWRALRLIIDTGLHHRGMTKEEAMKLFAEYAWDTTDKSLKEVIRYMSSPGQATAYMIGQLAIWNMRIKTENEFAKAGIKFNEKEFHYQVLSQGSSPLDYLIEYIDNYINCKINTKSRTDCPEILDPKLAAIQDKFETIGTEEKWNHFYEKMNVEHFD